MSWSGPAISEAPPQTTGGLPAAVPGHAPQDYRYATVPAGGFGMPEATVCTQLVCALRFPSQLSANDPCCISTPPEVTQWGVRNLDLVKMPNSATRMRRHDAEEGHGGAPHPSGGGSAAQAASPGGFAHTGAGAQMMASLLQSNPGQQLLVKLALCDRGCTLPSGVQ